MLLTIAQVTEQTQIFARCQSMVFFSCHTEKMCHSSFPNLFDLRRFAVVTVIEFSRSNRKNGEQTNARTHSENRGWLWIGNSQQKRRQSIVLSVTESTDRLNGAISHAPYRARKFMCTYYFVWIFCSCSSCSWLLSANFNLCMRSPTGGRKNVKKSN